MQRATRHVTDLDFLTAIDLSRNQEGEIIAMPAECSLYLEVGQRTLATAFVVTVLWRVVAYPMSYMLASNGYECDDSFAMTTLFSKSTNRCCPKTPKPNITVTGERITYHSSS